MTPAARGVGPTARAGAATLVALAVMGATVGLVAARARAPDRASVRLPPPETLSCHRDSTFALLDFWVGDWTVTSGGRRVGRDRVTKAVGGCAVVEEWWGAQGDTGQSLFYVAPGTRGWKQVWVTDMATAVGGTKEKAMVAHEAGRSTRFQGNLPLPDGRVILDRTTLTKVSEDTVHQVIETSRDGGTTWRAGFDADYTRTPRATQRE